jgi:hypothetical protein
MKREIAERSTILRGLVRSTVHGLAVDDGLEDRGEMGVCVEPFGVPMSLGEPFEQFIYRSAAEREGRQRAHSVRRLLGHGVQCPGRRRGLGDVRARHAVRAAAIPGTFPRDTLDGRAMSQLPPRNVQVFDPSLRSP